MAARNIKRVAEWECKLGYGKIYDVFYNSKTVTYFSENLPKTVARFIEDAEIHREHNVYVKKLGDDDKYHEVLDRVGIIHENAAAWLSLDMQGQSIASQCIGKAEYCYG